MKTKLKIISAILFNKYTWLLLAPFLIGWTLLAMRLQLRTDFVMYNQLSSVMQIWGGNLEQPAPSIRYKGISSDVSTLSVADVTSSDIVVKLEVDYRKKGLVYYTGYNAAFQGKYTINNPQKEQIYLSFIFPYPMKQGQGILQDVKLLINGQEDVDNTEYQQNLILWTGALEAAKTLDMTVEYKARGLNNFVYGFEAGKHINNFKMWIDVIGAQNVDFPVSTMTPTQITEKPNGVSLLWERNSSQSQLNIGVTLPDKINIARQCQAMVERAPFFFIVFLAFLLALIKFSEIPLNFIQIAVICVAYFLFYPLLAYLSMYMDVAFSFLLSFGIIGFLIGNYARVVYRNKIAYAIVAAYAFCLGITSLAALLPTYTGLILVVEGVVVVGIMMQALARHRDIKIGDLLASMIPREEPPDLDIHLKKGAVKF
jgi:hypothetical protein